MNLLVFKKNAELFGNVYEGVYEYYFESEDGLTKGMSLGFDRTLSVKEMELLQNDPYQIFEKAVV